MDMVVNQVDKLEGEVVLPGDKSISHRAVMLGALCEGDTYIQGFLPGDDCFSTVHCLQRMGVSIEFLGETEIMVRGGGLEGLKEPGDVLNAGNSGTTMRLLMGILAGQPFYSVITGDDSLRCRPMKRVITPLQAMGVDIWGRQRGSLAPVSISGSKRLRGIDYDSPVSSAQVKSAVLLAGIFAEGCTSVTEPVKSRDHTERMLRWMGADILESGSTVSIKGRPLLRGKEISVPGDISSAAFLVVAGCMVSQSEIMINNVGINPTRNGIIKVLTAMGGKIDILNERQQCGEPVADLLVRFGTLNGVEISGEIVPRLIDEIPVLAVAATQAEGTTVIKDCGELRFKETDRIKSMALELGRMGAQIAETKDGLIIEGPVRLKGAVCNSHGDHRIAMALAVAGMVADGETVIQNSECVDISFPGFFETVRGLLR